MASDSYVNPRSARGTDGCFGCRFRKKKCQRSDPNDPICDDCRRFNMECIGANEERPRRPGLSREARDILKEWIKAHSKEPFDPHEPPLSLRYLWERPRASSSSVQRSTSSLSQGPRDHRRSHSATSTSTYSVASSSQPTATTSYLPAQPAMDALLVENFLRTGSLNPGAAVTQTQTASMRHSHSRSHSNQYPHQSQLPLPYHAQSQSSSMPSQLGVSDLQRRVSDPGPSYHATLEVGGSSRPSIPIPSTHLTVPPYLGTHLATQTNHQPLMIFTDEQGTNYHPNSAYPYPPSKVWDTPLQFERSPTSYSLDIPWLNPNPNAPPMPIASYGETSPLSATYLSPSSPYASSIFSSGSSLDDGSWDQGPPSPSFFLNESFDTTVTGTGTQSQSQEQPFWFPPQMYPPSQQQ